MSMTVLYIAIGGALGAISRYLCSNWVLKLLGDLLPYGTMAVNILGSFLLGMIYTISLNTTSFSGNFRGLLTIGFIGSFTTFSTFTTETVNLLKEGNILYGSIYLGASILFGLIAVLLGMGAANFFLVSRERGENSEPQDNRSRKKD
jgi:CrcB protein